MIPHSENYNSTSTKINFICGAGLSDLFLHSGVTRRDDFKSPACVEDQSIQTFLVYCSMFCMDLRGIPTYTQYLRGVSRNIKGTYHLPRNIYIYLFRKGLWPVA